MFIKSFSRQTEDKMDINWKNFYKQVCLLIIPMALQNLINVGVQAADVFMLGRVGEKVLSGASLAGQIQFIMTLILFGTTSGATVLTAQYWVKKDTRTIEKILGMGMLIGIGGALAFALAAELIPETLLRIYTNDPEVIAEGAKYLRIVALSYVIMAATQVYLYIMRSIERVVIATVVYGASLIVNIIVNAVLIFGLMGFPKMGIEGAAIGTLISRILGLMIVIWYAKFRNKVVRFHLSDMWNIDKVLLKDFLFYATPVILNELVWGMGSSANTAVIGHLGSAAVAANSVVQVVRELSTVVVFGVSNATAIYLGKTIGERQYELAKAYGRRFAVLSVITGFIAAGIILVSAPAVSRFMTLSPEAKSYLMFMFFVMSYFVLCQAINTTLVVGVFRSGGDTRFGLRLDATTMWCCSILLGAIAAFVCRASVPVVYALLMSDEVIKVPITVKRFLGYKWIKNVTREQEELAMD